MAESKPKKKRDAPAPDDDLDLGGTKIIVNRRPIAPTTAGEPTADTAEAGENA